MKLITIDMDALAKAIDSNTDASEQDARAIINTVLYAAQGKDADPSGDQIYDGVTTHPEFGGTPSGGGAQVEVAALKENGDMLAFRRCLTQTRGYIALRELIRQLRENGSASDDEGEDTDALEILADALATHAGHSGASGSVPAPYNGENWGLLAMALAAEENDDIHHLIWEGGPVPEPWGEVWQKYEGEAKRMIALVREHATPAELGDAKPDSFHVGSGATCGVQGAGPTDAQKGGAA